MDRRLFAVVGLAIVAAVAAMVAAFGDPDPVSGAATGTLLLAGLLFVSGGLRERVGPLRWHQLVGVGVISLGLTSVILVLGTLPTGEPTDIPGAVGMVGTALVFAFVGVDVFRGGHHFDLSKVE